MLDKGKVGKMIALQRKASDLTQKELADLLHVSYQAVSKWELGLSLPTVDMIYDIAELLNVTVDYLLNADEIDNRDICYKDTGLDTVRLYDIKAQVDQMVTKDPHVLYSHFTDPIIMQVDTDTGVPMKDPVYALITNVPGSKQRLSKERGYDKEICADLASHAINNMLKTGLMPKVLQAHMVCGNCDEKQILSMGEAFKQICEDSHVIFAGMEISSQPINYLAGEYELSAALIGQGERTDLITPDLVKEGDVIIAIKTEGIESSSFPFIRVMLDRKPQLAYEKINEQSYFMDEILKPNLAYTDAVRELGKRKLATHIWRVGNTFLDQGQFSELPNGLGAVIDLSTVRVDEMYRFIASQNLLGKKFLPYRFSLGVGMMITVPKERELEALMLINRYNEGYVIGNIVKWDESMHKSRVITKGKIRW